MLLSRHRPATFPTSRSGLWPMLNIFTVVFAVIVSLLIIVALGAAYLR